jgi:hypothetical protein
MPKTDIYFSPEQYATVAERIELFYARFPQGRINTELVARVDGEVTFKALVYRDSTDALPASTGWASEREGDGDINTVACLENTETSAVGRALANLGFTASTKRPSREEMEKAARVRNRLSSHQQNDYEIASRQRQADATDDVLRLIRKAELKGFPPMRARVLRQQARQPSALPESRVRKVEASLRAWIRRREM